MSNKTDKGYISHPPTGEQLERIKAACATTRLESVDAENLLKELGYQFRVVPAPDNQFITVPEVKSSRRDWRPLHLAWNAIKQNLRDHGVRVGNPTVMLKFEDVASRLAWENRRPELEDLSTGRYPFYWESDPNA